MEFTFFQSQMQQVSVYASRHERSRFPKRALYAPLMLGRAWQFRGTCCRGCVVDVFLVLNTWFQKLIIFFRQWFVWIWFNFVYINILWWQLKVCLIFRNVGDAESVRLRSEEWTRSCRGRCIGKHVILCFYVIIDEKLLC